jgi:hypothetical protein
VTVEAASPALIEKVRAAITDGSGQYRIENLRPGDYEVTFALTGFRSVRRQGIELTGSFVATVNADLQVGSLEETITVSGEAPVVDVQSAKRQEVLSNDVIAAIPTGRSYNALMVLIPGVAVTSADIATGPCGACTFGVHGRNNEGRVQVDGIGQGASLAGTTSGLITDPGNAQEVNVTTSGGLGEAETSGPIMNFVPKTGGNTVHGSFFSSGSNSAMQATFHRAQGGGARGAELVAKSLGRERLGRRAAEEGQAVVFRDRPDARRRSNGHQHVPQPERRQGRRLDVCAGSESSGVSRSDVGERERPPHLAGGDPCQVRRFLGRAGDLPAVHRCRSAKRVPEPDDFA